MVPRRVCPWAREERPPSSDTWFWQSLPLRCDELAATPDTHTHTRAHTHTHTHTHAHTHAHTPPHVTPAAAAASEGSWTPAEGTAQDGSRRSSAPKLEPLTSVGGRATASGVGPGLQGEGRDHSWWHAPRSTEPPGRPRRDLLALIH